MTTSEIDVRLLAIVVDAAIGIGAVVWFVVWLGGFAYDITKSRARRSSGRRRHTID